MTLTIDIGNTAIKYAVFDNDGTMLQYGRTEGHDDVSAILRLCTDYAPEHAIIASTADVSRRVQDEIGALAKHTVVLDSATPLPIENLYHTPQTLGKDRLAAAVAAFDQTHGDTLIIDVGTAITYDFINCNGQFLGGNISPGVNLRFMALKEHTAKLPLISAEGCHPEYGCDTETAIRCGVLDGISCEIQGYIRKFSLKYPNLSVFLTGGDQIYFDEAIKKRTFADKYLVLKGLFLIMQYNINAD
ncbi:MAG: type III pantothenate kinase [Bacteroidaceae bacterium]|nr:type III pantothenate kinase [Bacteroidaceae bacterium]